MSRNKMCIGQTGPMGPQGQPGPPGDQITADDMNQYLDLIMSLIGYDLTFERFRKLNQSERVALIRNIKIDKLIK